MRPPGANLSEFFVIDPDKVRRIPRRDFELVRWDDEVPLAYGSAEVMVRLAEVLGAGIVRKRVRAT